MLSALCRVRLISSISSVRTLEHSERCPQIKSSAVEMSFLGKVFSRNSHSLTNGEVEFKACKTSEIKDNEFKVVKKGDYEVLISKHQGEYYATGTKCTHYGAPLAKGVFKDGRLICPWHNACFSVTSGDIEDFPAFSQLPCYRVKVKNGDIWVGGNPVNLNGSQFKLPIKSRGKEFSNQHFIIIGSGAAGYQCAVSLRQLGFGGEITMLTQDGEMPYDRTKLSKSLDTPIENILLKPLDEYKNSEIQIKTSSGVKSINTKEKNIICDDGTTFSYDKVFLASGSEPRKLAVPGAELDNIFYLRDHRDAQKISKSFADKDVVICGTSFIGLEIASSIFKQAKSIVLVGNSKYPCVHVVGEVIGKALQDLYESKGMRFLNETTIKQFEGENGCVKYAVIDGEKVPCDVCLVGIGTVPYSQYLKTSNLSLSSSGHVDVNEKMATTVDSIYAGGDLVKFPLKLYDTHTSIGHWQIAQFHGKVAAHSMLDKTCDTSTVPCFWTSLLGKNLRYAGYSAGHDNIIISGSVENWKFVAQFMKQGKVVAVLTCGYDPLAGLFKALLMKERWIKEEEIGGVPPQWSIDSSA
ncbi:apoptosis-inducing factor 3-like [Brevipalpus obovatus]|uniref:apoptosis-inducing factor 3-like n=1 Tax=Brevipalpus obovatus TaxID=246614 RepID=UPI003D9F4886